MNEFFEIAYAVTTNRLCLFTGTGFSKAISENAAPSWQGLLENCCDLLPTGANLKAELFPVDGKNLLSLEDSAQVIDIELKKISRSIHDEIANLIGTVELKGDNSIIETFVKTFRLRVITTNYDKLLESFADEDKVQSMTPGLPIPRFDSNLEVFHVHGSLDSPQNMVVTSDDYFKFLNKDTYFSRKLSTVLHENTVVILGYSLGDTNLKTIISDYKGFSTDLMTMGNIFFVSRSPVSQSVKDFYYHSFGIRVLENLETKVFFECVISKVKEAEDCHKNITNSINRVLQKKATINENYLKLERAFYEIVASLNALGKSLMHPEVSELLVSIIKSKVNFTNEDDAWVQYVQLAKWLVHLGSIVELKNPIIKDAYFVAVLHSMTSMSRRYLIGRSWHAFEAWKQGWLQMSPNNRKLVRDYINGNAEHYEDAVFIVSLG